MYKAVLCLPFVGWKEVCSYNTYLVKPARNNEKQIVLVLFVNIIRRRFAIEKIVSSFSSVLEQKKIFEKRAIDMQISLRITLYTNLFHRRKHRERFNNSDSLQLLCNMSSHQQQRRTSEVFRIVCFASDFFFTFHFQSHVLFIAVNFGRSKSIRSFELYKYVCLPFFAIGRGRS